MRNYIHYNKVNENDFDAIALENNSCEKKAHFHKKGLFVTSKAEQEKRRIAILRAHKANKLPRIREARRIKSRARKWLASDERMRYSYPQISESQGYILDFIAC